MRSVNRPLKASAKETLPSWLKSIASSEVSAPTAVLPSPLMSTVTPSKSAIDEATLCTVPASLTTWVTSGKAALSLASLATNSMNWSRTWFKPAVRPAATGSEAMVADNSTRGSRASNSSLRLNGGAATGAATGRRIRRLNQARERGTSFMPRLRCAQWRTPHNRFQPGPGSTAGGNRPQSRPED